jgi:ribosome biogenesis GTPase
LQHAIALESLGWNDELEAAFQPFKTEEVWPARVLAQHRGGYVVRGEHKEFHAVARGRLRDQAAVGGAVPAVGDWVVVRPSGDGRAAIEDVLPRRSKVSRKTAWFEAEEQVLATNVDTLFLVSGLDRDFNTRRLERYVAIAYESGAAPVVVLTKLDLCDEPARVLEAEAVAIGIPVVPLSNVTGEGIEELQPFLAAGQTVALIGSSGVGKSTLINRLLGEDVIATAALRRDGRGRHTTRHRELFVLPDGALLIDTPGLRELQLWEGDLDDAFADITALGDRCRFTNCAHDTEPDCAVKGALAEGALAPERLASFRKLERELASVAARADKRLGAERKRRWRQRARESRQTRRYGAR